MGFCTSCGKEILDNENFCSSCGSNVNQKTSTQSVVTEKRSNFWYLAPILFSIFGGVVAFFILRKPDPSKAKNCLVLGIGFFIIWTAVTMASVTDDSSTEINNNVNREIESRDISNKEITQGTIPIPKPAAPKPSNTNEFDAEIVEAAKENIPKIQSLPREILEQCRAVKSYSDYVTFLLVIGVMSDELIEIFEKMDTLLTILEIQGYDKHSEVGPLIKETRNLAMRTSDCMDDLTRKYGN